jgi:hypothetical protein
MNCLANTAAGAAAGPPMTDTNARLDEHREKMRQRRETGELGTIKATMGRAFGAGVFVLGFICALLRIG